MRVPATMACALCPMHDSGLSAGVDAQLLPALEREKTTQLLRSGQTLFCEGGPAHGVHCVQSGLLKLYKLGVGGEPLLLRLCGPGTLLGLRSVLADEAHEATAEAIQDSVVCSLPRLNFEVCVGSSPAMAVRIMREFAIEMREAHERMMELAHCDVLQRAAHLLVSIHEQALCPTPSRRSPGAHLKHMDLAAMIGTSPETMSRVLHTLDRRGVIKVTGDGIQVVDVAKLTAIARIPAVPGRA